MATTKEIVDVISTTISKNHPELTYLGLDPIDIDDLCDNCPTFLISAGDIGCVDTVHSIDHVYDLIVNQTIKIYVFLEFVDNFLIKFGDLSESLIKTLIANSTLNHTVLTSYVRDVCLLDVNEDIRKQYKYLTGKEITKFSISLDITKIIFNDKEIKKDDD